jgi:hypothetical protein
MRAVWTMVDRCRSTPESHLSRAAGPDKWNALLAPEGESCGSASWGPLRRYSRGHTQIARGLRQVAVHVASSEGGNAASQLDVATISAGRQHVPQAG